MVKVSFIISTHNEEKSNFFSKSLERLGQLKECEVIICDGKSSDKTLDIVKSFAASSIIIEDAGETRAQRLNRGIELSKGEMIVLHHPRNIISIKGLNYLLENYHLKIWGGFTHTFDSGEWYYSLTSWYSNQVRAKLKSIFYLDHCLFFHKSMKKFAVIPRVAIFEDTELSLILRNVKSSVLLPMLTQTSAIRFKKNGFLKQAVKNQMLKWAYYFNISDTVMNKNYEKGIGLNNQYEK